MKRILFTGVGRRVELLQAFKNAALVLGKDIKLYGADSNDNAPALTYCDYKLTTVSMLDKGYIPQLLDICRAEHIDLVIPTIDTDLLKLSESKDRFMAIGTRVLISESDKVKICRNKNLTAKFFVDNGLHTPLPVDDWQKYEAEFPAFIKPQDGSSSINAYKVNNTEELRIYAGKIKDYIVQPFVIGREFTIDIFCDWNGEPVTIVPRERLQVRAGEVLKTKLVMDFRMIDESNIICQAFKPCGPITVQLIRDKHDVDWFIEINPRFGGGAPLSMKAGARSAETVLKLLDNESPDPQSVSDGAVYSRFDQSVCVNEGNGAKVKGVIFDLDDTLYSEKKYVKSGYRAVSDYLGGGYEEQLWKFFETGKSAIDELLKELGRESEKTATLNIYRSHKPNIHLYPNVLTMLQSLKSEGLRIGIITDGRPEGQKNKLEALGLYDVVDDVIITDELGGSQFRKPCDIAFRILARRWRLNPADVVYVGDNPAKDFQGPQQLGMRSIWLRNTDGLYSNKVNDRTVHIGKTMDFDLFWDGYNL